MSKILVVGEDSLCCALGEQLVSQAMPGWSLARASIDTGGVTKLVPALPRFIEVARHVQPVLCVADTDHECPVELLQAWIPDGGEDRLLIRLAVSEVESWLLSDRERLAEFFGISVANVPRALETLPDAKREILRLARISRVREIRNEVVSALDPSKRGTGYNIHLSRFIRERWRAAEASELSPSLLRSLERVSAFGAEFGQT